MCSATKEPMAWTASCLGPGYLISGSRERNFSKDSLELVVPEATDVIQKLEEKRTDHPNDDEHNYGDE